MAMTPDHQGPKRPHPAWRARRVTAVVSGVAFAGLVGGMAIEASTSPAHATTPDPIPTPEATLPQVETTQPPWAAPIAPQPDLQTPSFQRAPHTQSHGS